MVSLHRQRDEGKEPASKAGDEKALSYAPKTRRLGEAILIWVAAPMYGNANAL